MFKVQTDPETERLKSHAEQAYTRALELETTHPALACSFMSQAIKTMPMRFLQLAQLETALEMANHVLSCPTSDQDATQQARHLEDSVTTIIDTLPTRAIFS